MLLLSDLAKPISAPDEVDGRALLRVRRQEYLPQGRAETVQSPGK